MIQRVTFSKSQHQINVISTHTHSVSVVMPETGFQILSQMSAISIVLAAMQLRLAQTYLTFGKLHAKTELHFE